MHYEKLIILGSGPAALTAALYAARAGLNPLIIEGPKPGGQLMNTTAVENWPGIQSIMGPELMFTMRAHAQKFGTRFLSESATHISKHDNIITIQTNKNKQLSCHSLIIATGASHKKLGCPGEDTYWTKGVSNCAVCDGAFYRDKHVVIVGGGDTAMEDASFMTNFTEKITIVHILDKLTASHSMQQRVLSNPKIHILYSSTVTAIQGNDTHVTHVEIKNTQTHTVTQLTADAVFVAIGLTPQTTPFKGTIDLLDNGYIAVTNATHTSVPGIFVAGDVADFRYRQAITSAGTGCMAALDAEKYLKELGI